VVKFFPFPQVLDAALKTAAGAMFSWPVLCVCVSGGTGKSYTVVGTPSEPGLVPRALEVIFTSFELKTLEEVRLVPERFSELRRIRDDQELEDRLRLKEGLLNLVRVIFRSTNILSEPRACRIMSEYIKGAE